MKKNKQLHKLTILIKQDSDKVLTGLSQKITHNVPTQHKGII